MGNSYTIEELIKYAEAQSTLPATSAPKQTSHVQTTDIEKFAAHIENVGKLLKLGQEPGPQGPGPAITPPPTGTQAPVDDESKTHDPTKSSLDAGGEVSNDEDTPVTGDQPPVAMPSKISSLRERVIKIAEEVGQVGLPPSDATQPPGNVGYTAPPDTTGLPQDPKQVPEVAQGDIERTNVDVPMQPLFKEKLEPGAEQMKEALPEAAKETDASPEAAKHAAAEEAMGRIAAHSFVQELNTILEGGG